MRLFSKYILNHRLIILTAIGFFASIKSQANSNYRFEHLTVDQGLSQSYVNALVQDHMGFLWIGTDYGVNRYDGYNFKIYKYDRTDSTSLSSNRISHIYIDRSNQLWIGTDQGLHLYNRAQDNFIRYQTKPDGSGISNNSIDCVFEDSQGHIWIGTIEGLNLFNRKNNSFTHFLADPENPKSLTENRVVSIVEDFNNQLWLATSNGLTRLDLNTMEFTRYQHKNNDPYSLKANDVNRLIVDYQGTLWIGYRAEGLGRLDKDREGKERFIHYDLSQNGTNPSNNNAYSLALTENGKLWIGTSNGGLNLFNISDKTFLNYQNEKNDPFSLSTNSIHSICIDRGGNVWLGTNNAGLNVIKKYKQAIRSYWMMEGNPNSLSHNSVTAFSEGSDGKIWIGTDGGGLDLYDPETGNFRHFNTQNSGLNRDAILDITQSKDGFLWLCTWGGGVNRFDPRNGQVVTYTTENTGLISDNLMNLDIDQHGNLWIATNRMGLIEFNPITRTVIHYNQENSNIHDLSLTDIEVSQDDDVLIGGYNGLCIFDKETHQFTVYRHDDNDTTSISSDVINSIFEASDGTIWLGTQIGLNQFDREKGVFTKYYESDGLPNEIIMQIVEDNNHNLWISTKKGLSHFNLTTREFKNYYQSDGLQSNDYNRRSGIRTRSGHLYFGGVKGFSVFHPDSLKLNENPPPVVITDFQLFNKPVSIGQKDSPIKAHVSISDQIELHYRQNEFSFEFVSLDFTAPEKNQYAYILEGYDEHDAWHYVGTQRKATYTNMNPDKYTFRVKASNNDGIWNEEGVSLNIIIKPPLWGTWWFRVLLVIFILFFGITVYKYRTRSIKAHNQQLEREVALRTEEAVKRKDEIEHTYDRMNQAVKIITESMEKLTSLADIVSETSSEFNNTSQRLATGASEHASSISEMSTSLQELFTSASANATNAQDANLITSQTQSLMTTSLDDMKDLSGVIKRIHHATNETETVIRTMEEIATMIQMLSVNAAIEAMRAGDTGKGFQAVAKEVQKLAEQSESAVQNTKNLIHNAIEHVEKGTQINQDVVKRFKTVGKYVERLTGFMSEISAASIEQKLGIDQINTGVEQLNKVMQMSTEIAHQSVERSENLSSNVQELHALVNVLMEAVKHLAGDQK